jgi:hypothetical protein
MYNNPRLTEMPCRVCCFGRCRAWLGELATSRGGDKVSEEERGFDGDDADGCEPFTRPEDFLDEEGRIRFAPSDQIGEWEEEIERWLPEAVGYSIFDALVTDLSGLTDFMETDLENPRTDEDGREYYGLTGKGWQRARSSLLRYGVDIECESDLTLVTLAKKTLGREPKGRGR